MSKKCVAFSKSKLGLEKTDNRKSFYAGWDAALAAQAEQEPVALNHALQLAESALLSYEDITIKQWDMAIAAIRAVKESLTVEPLRFGCLYPGGRLEVFKTRKIAQEYVDGSLRNGADVKLIELYAAPVRTKDLTDDELAEREACAKDRLGSNRVVLEKHTQSDDGLIAEIISE